MRRTLGLAAAAVLAAGTIGVQSGTATSASADGVADAAHTTSAAATPTASTRSDRDLAARALRALDRAPRLARDSVEQELVPTDTILDRDGTTHVRFDRTYQGLPVLGGDLVVHQAPDADRVADLVLRHLVADRDHAADDLVPGDGRVRHRAPLAADEVKIGVADAAEADLDADVARAGLAPLDPLVDGPHVLP